MSFLSSRPSRAGYTPIQDAVPARNLGEIENLGKKAEIKYDPQIGGYHSTSNKPQGSLLQSTLHALTRTPADRKKFRAAIDQMAQDIEREHGRIIGAQFKSRFYLRRELGQPVTVDAYHDFLKHPSHGALGGGIKDFQRSIANLKKEKVPFSEDFSDDEEEE